MKRPKTNLDAQVVEASLALNALADFHVAVRAALEVLLEDSDLFASEGEARPALLATCRRLCVVGRRLSLLLLLQLLRPLGALASRLALAAGPRLLRCRRVGRRRVLLLALGLQSAHGGRVGLCLRIDPLPVSISSRVQWFGPMVSGQFDSNSNWGPSLIPNSIRGGN